MSVEIPWPKAPIEESVLKMLQDILRDWCAETGNEFSSAMSQDKARDLVHWFEFGVQDAVELAELIRASSDIPKRSASAFDDQAM